MSNRNLKIVFALAFCLTASISKADSFDSSVLQGKTASELKRDLQDLYSQRDSAYNTSTKEAWKVLIPAYRMGKATRVQNRAINKYNNQPFWLRNEDKIDRIIAKTDRRIDKNLKKVVRHAIPAMEKYDEATTLQAKIVEHHKQLAKMSTNIFSDLYHSFKAKLAEKRLNRMIPKNEKSLAGLATFKKDFKAYLPSE